MWHNPGEIAGNGVDDDGDGVVDDVYGYDGAGTNGTPDGDPMDPANHGHGTGVAGIIGASGNNALGVAGVNWNVKIMALKFFADTSEFGDTFAEINDLEYAIMQKQRGVNLVAINGSFGSIQAAESSSFNSAEEIEIQHLTDAGVLFIASAGNSGIDNDGPVTSYPASYPNPYIISVAATDNKDALAVWNGPTSASEYGRTTVDVGAPGKDCLSTAVGGGYWWFAGTSCAAPYTTGVIALMASVNARATKDDLRTQLFASVDVLPSLTGKVATNGRIDAFKAVVASRASGLFVQTFIPGAEAANVSELDAYFSETVDPSFFNIADVLLERANGASSFNGSQTPVDLSTASVTLTGNHLSIVFPSRPDTRPVPRHAAQSGIPRLHGPSPQWRRDAGKRRCPSVHRGLVPRALRAQRHDRRRRAAVPHQWGGDDQRSRHRRRREPRVGRGHFQDYPDRAVAAQRGRAFPLAAHLLHARLVPAGVRRQRRRDRPQR